MVFVAAGKGGNLQGGGSVTAVASSDAAQGWERPIGTRVPLETMTFTHPWSPIQMARHRCQVPRRRQRHGRHQQWQPLALGRLVDQPIKPHVGGNVPKPWRSSFFMGHVGATILIRSTGTSTPTWRHAKQNCEKEMHAGYEVSVVATLS